MKTMQDFRNECSRQRAAALNKKLSEYGPLGNINNKKQQSK